MLLLLLLLPPLLHCQVLGTATLRGEGTSTMEPKSAVATANIGVYAPAPATTDDALVNPVPANNTPDHPINAVAKDSKTEFASVNDSTPTTAANDTSSSEADVTVTLDDVSTKLIADAVWSLKVLPVGMPGDKATMAASAGLNMTFNVHYTQTVEKVRQHWRKHEASRMLHGPHQRLQLYWVVLRQQTK
jgi:hypothetical protein